MKVEDLRKPPAPTMPKTARSLVPGYYYGRVGGYFGLFIKYFDGLAHATDLSTTWDDCLMFSPGDSLTRVHGVIRIER